MSAYGAYGGEVLGTGSDAASLFGSTMAFVAGTIGWFALGAYLGRGMGNVGWLFFLASFGLLIALRFVQSSGPVAIVILFTFGFTFGLAVGPTVAYYAAMDPRVVWQAGGATALFMAAMGTAGWGIRRDLTALARVALWMLFALIIAGVIALFVNIPGASLAYSIIGLAIFAVLTMFDFQRLRRSRTIDSPSLMAASIFLDAVNVFLFFLNIFGRND
jgi:FtsH-binding integral membrane protein